MRTKPLVSEFLAEKPQLLKATHTRANLLPPKPAKPKVMFYKKRIIAPKRRNLDDMLLDWKEWQQRAVIKQGGFHNRSVPLLERPADKTSCRIQFK